MKLLALYIKHYRHCFEDICFNFASDYKVTYSENLLSIHRKSNILNGFYGEHISDLSLIIGKNGTGKSSILNIIGSMMKERIENLEYGDSQILDRYFLLYLVTDNVFYLEFLGNDFEFTNVKIKARENLVFSTYISNHQEPTNNYIELTDDECLKYNALYDGNRINDRIVYINNNINTSTFSMYSPNKQSWLLLRNNSMLISWEHWYESCIELYQREIIESRIIKIKFFQAENVNMIFQLLPDNEDDVVERINNIFYVKETFHDLLAHQISITINFILNTLKDINNNDEETIIEINRFIHKWKKNVVIDKAQIEIIFDELKKIIDKKKPCTFDRGILFLSEIIDLYVSLYLSMLDIKEHIIPGIDSFELIVNANESSRAIRVFLNNVDYLLGYINKPLFDEKSLEEGQYYSEEEMNFMIPESFRRTNNRIIPLISQGENNIVTLFSKIKYELQRNINISQLHSYSPLDNITPCYLFLIDEVESGMHIEWSRNFISQLITIIDDLAFKCKDQTQENVKLQLIMTTHSPFIVSDVLNNSIIELSKKDANSIVVEKTHNSSFAQNFQRIISDEFFMDKFCGEYALQKVQRIIDIIRDNNKISAEEQNRIEALIEEIGEPIVRNKIKQMYRKYLQASITAK